MSTNLSIYRGEKAGGWAYLDKFHLSVAKQPESGPDAFKMKFFFETAVKKKGSHYDCLFYN
jgi:hypothetical protein